MKYIKNTSDNWPYRPKVVKQTAFSNTYCRVRTCLIICWLALCSLNTYFT